MTRANAAPPPAASLTWNQVPAWRLKRQHLARRVAKKTAWLDTTSTTCGRHAHVRSSAELTLWARTDGLPPGTVERALWHDRTLVKTWAMRGTLHLLAVSDLPFYVAAQGALKPRHHADAWQRYYGVTSDEAEAKRAAIRAALDGQQLTREELADAVARHTGAAHLAEKLRGGFGDLLKPAAFRGDLCFAPTSGKRVRFVRPDPFLPDRPSGALPDPETAMAEVLRRYLAV